MDTNLKEIIELYKQPSDWPKVSAALNTLHTRIEGQDSPTIASIARNYFDFGSVEKQQLHADPSSKSAKLTSLILETLLIADSCGQTDFGNQTVPRHNPDVYHTFNHFREAVIDTIVLVGVYNKAVASKQIGGTEVSREQLITLIAAMALHDWKRGLGPSEAAYGMEIRAAVEFAERAKVHDVSNEVIQNGVIAILGTSPFVAMNPDKTWFVAGAQVGNFAFLADQVDNNPVLSSISGLTERLRAIHAGNDNQGLLIAQLATCADVLSGTVLGREHSEKNNRRVGIETARAKGDADPNYNDSGLAIAQAGKGFLGYIGQLPAWMDKLTDGAFGSLKTAYEADVARLTCQYQ